MFEKVNPDHPDKVADRIAGALVDLAYSREQYPRVALEILIGHGECIIKGESSFNYVARREEVEDIVHRITRNGTMEVFIDVAEQDELLAQNQQGKIKCGDNGIFKGVPTNSEENGLTDIVKYIHRLVHSDGKYISCGNSLIVCQSMTDGELLDSILAEHVLARNFDRTVNPIGDWTGGTDVDTGAVNRKLGSDMGRAVTGGGLHGKDLSKADVSVNIYAHLKAQNTHKEVEICCAIGDEYVDGVPYSDIVQVASDYIKGLGGFEKFAEYGLIRGEE